jgi:hypothetical protein
VDGRQAKPRSLGRKADYSQPRRRLSKFPGGHLCVSGKSKKNGCTYTPPCGCVYTRKKLVKTEETKKVPTTKCVFEYLCESCCTSCGCE